MDMGSAGPFKHAGNQDFVMMQQRPADRAAPVPSPVKAIQTAPDIHHPVLSGK
jgi:hypothetical protein